MFIDIFTILATLTLFMAITYSYSKHGILNLLPRLFPKGSINDEVKTKWMTFTVEQSEKPNIIFLSNAKLGFSEQGLFVRYIFPFSLFMKGFDIPVNRIYFLPSKKIYGFLFNVMKIQGVDSGCLMFPVIFRCKPDVTWWPK